MPEQPIDKPEPPVTPIEPTPEVTPDPVNIPETEIPGTAPQPEPAAPAEPVIPQNENGLGEVIPPIESVEEPETDVQAERLEGVTEIPAEPQAPPGSAAETPPNSEPAGQSENVQP